ncbi:TIGR03943 family putative permease subunit [Microbacterium gorillae]|uniref:TIGR03943 family putative permease subunit n=1 Tax=Microbacterium gorillae TaxID=1231063 RepID=UPI000693E6D6|nr:hypothetical protein [Microbacterium gorillae]
MSDLRSIGARWLGLGLAVAVCAVTIVLAVTGNLQLYISPSSSVWAVGMAVLGVVIAVAAAFLPAGAEAEHGHDHGHAHTHVPAPVVPSEAAETDAPLTRAQARALRDRLASEAVPEPHEQHRPRAATALAAVTGGVIATVIAGAMVLLPPASLSAELAMERDLGTPPLFGGNDVVALASTGDLASFGIGDWSQVFATAADPDQFVGTPVSLVGFVGADARGGTIRLTRLVIRHCVIDAQPAALPVTAGQWRGEFASGQWVKVTGTVGSGADGALVITPTDIAPIDEPGDPYEF